MEDENCPPERLEVMFKDAEHHADEDYTAAAIALESHFINATIAYETSNKEAAAKHIQQGLHRYGRDSKSLHNAGVFFARRDEYEQARTYFEEALAFDPEHRPSLEAIARLEGMGH